MRQVFSGAHIFDGARLLHDYALIVEDGVVTGLEKGVRGDVVLDGGVLAPAFVDLQVNGGGGIVLDQNADAGRIAAICATHILFGCAGVLPTLRPRNAGEVAQVLAASIEAARAKVPGFLGLHLEGPHLDPKCCEKHGGVATRPMTDADVAQLLAAVKALPVLMVTVAPASVTPAQVAALTKGGVVISLGHSLCSYEEALTYREAGARSVTHLFNARAPMSPQAPGLTGAVLDGDLAGGIVADATHVSPMMLRLATTMRPDGLYLVSDCCAFAEMQQDELPLGGQQMTRRDGQLHREDGTVVGVDIRMERAIGLMVAEIGVAPVRALAMATSTPAGLIGMGQSLGQLLPGRRADMVHLAPDWSLAGVWWGGVQL